MRFLPKSLMFRLISYFLLLSLVTVGLAGYIAFIQVRESLKQSVFERLNAVVTLKEDELERWIGLQRQDVIVIAQLPNVQTYTEQLFKYSETSRPHQIAYQHLSDVLASIQKANPDIEEIFILSRVGGQILVSSNKAHEEEYRVQDIYFVQGREAPFVQNVYASPVTFKPMMTVATPLDSSDGEPLAVLAAHINLTRMDQIIKERSGLGVTGGETYLVDDLNVFVSAERFGREAFPRGVHSAGIDSAIQTKTDGNGLYLNYAGVPVIGVYRWLEDRDLALLAEIPQAEAFAPARQLAQTILGIGLALAGVLSGGVYILARQVTHPIRALAATAQAIQGGDLTRQARLPGLVELDTLAETFNRMTAQLRQTLADLEQRVRELAEANRMLVEQVAERKRAEAELRKHRDHLEELVAERARELVQVISQLEREINERRQTEAALQQVNTALKQRVGELSAINSIGQVIASQLQLDMLVESVGEKIHETFDVPVAYVALYQAESGQIEFPYIFEKDPRPLEKAISFEEGLVSHIVDLKMPLLLNQNIEQYYTQLDIQPVGAIPKSYLGVPIILRDEVIGVLSVQHLTQENYFDTADLRLLTTIASQSAIAIQNARLLIEEQRQRQMAESLREVATILNSSLDQNTVIAKILEQLRRVVQYDSSAIFLEAEGELVLVGGIGLRSASIGDRISATGQEPVCHVFQKKRSRWIDDVRDEPDWSTTEPARSWMSVPLVVGDNPIGVITIDSFEIGAYNEDDSQTLQLFANQAAVAIQNAQLFEAQQTITESLAKTVKQLKATQNQLIVQEKMASLGQLTSGIAHEIKNPLNFINNFAFMSLELTQELTTILDSQQEKLPAAVRSEVKEIVEYLAFNATKINEEGRRADSIVRSMLLHSRGGGKEREQADINKLLTETINLAYHSLRASYPDFTITIETDYDSTLQPINGILPDLSRVFVNLLNNACYATTKKRETAPDDYQPTLIIRTKNLADQIEIRIWDNGTGISPIVRDRLFEPFFTTKPTGEGTGLGLSISYDIIVQGHQGTITVDSVPGQYTEFIIQLPK